MRLCTSRKRGVPTVCCVHGYHAAVGELHACKREAKNAVGIYIGGKDELLDIELKLVIRLPRVICGY